MHEEAAAPVAPPGTAQKLLRWMAGYTHRHSLTEFDQEAHLAAELAGLLDQREELVASQVEQLAALMERGVVMR